MPLSVVCNGRCRVEKISIWLGFGQAVSLAASSSSSSSSDSSSSSSGGDNHHRRGFRPGFGGLGGAYPPGFLPPAAQTAPMTDDKTVTQDQLTAFLVLMFAQGQLNMHQKGEETAARTFAAVTDADMTDRLFNFIEKYASGNSSMLGLTQGALLTQSGIMPTTSMMPQTAVMPQTFAQAVIPQQFATVQQAVMPHQVAAVQQSALRVAAPPVATTTMSPAITGAQLVALPPPMAQTYVAAQPAQMITHVANVGHIPAQGDNALSEYAALLRRAYFTRLAYDKLMLGQRAQTARAEGANTMALTLLKPSDTAKKMTDIIGA